MTAYYVPLFLALLVGYLVSSGWAGIDSRYPFVLAGGLLAATTVAEIVGDRTTGNILAEYVLLLLAGGVILLAIDRHRARPVAPALAIANIPQAETGDSAGPP